MKYTESKKEPCFADIHQDVCYSLTDKKCRGCAFYRTRKQAKEEYMKHIDKARENNIAIDIDKFFINL